MMRAPAILLLSFSLSIAAAGGAADLPGSIGVATMSADGTIKLHLVAKGKNGEIGDGILVYRPGDPMYDEVKQHLGGIKPGEEKPVPPWRNNR